MKNIEKNKNKDDGRVVADMSVLNDITPRLTLKSRKSKKKKKLDSQDFSFEDQSKTFKLSKEEKRAIAFGVIKAHLLYALFGLILLGLVFFLAFKFWLN